jgi:rubrerythrin
MDDSDQDDLLGPGGVFGKLRADLDRRRSVEAGAEDLFESADGELPDWWMCQGCGAFMKEHREQCTRCHEPRF